MAVSPSAETVEITSEPRLIDIRQSASFATLHADILSRLFAGADFTAAIQIAPGARAETKAGGTQIDGASSSEHRFILDGIDTTNLRTGVSGKPMLVDFIEEVQVKSSGYAAEFGGAIGGVVTARTRSGSNQVRGSAGFFQQNNQFRDLCGRPATTRGPTSRKTTCWITACRGSCSSRGEMGGPVVKDRLWSYGAFSSSGSTYHEDVTFLADPSLASRRITQTNPDPPARDGLEPQCLGFRFAERRVLGRWPSCWCHSPLFMPETRSRAKKRRRAGRPWL